MVITLVMDQYGESSNGTTVTARRLAEELRKRGHTIKVVTSSNINEKDALILKVNKIPIVHQVARTQGMQFAKPDKKKLREFFKGSDLIHFLMPFKTSRVGKKIADEMGIPTTAAFHVQPENITYTLGIEKIQPINKALYLWFRRFYKKFDHVHCPSNMIKNQLVKNNYPCITHVVSNGVKPTFIPKETEKPLELKDKFIIMMTARFSREKRQDLLIKAVSQSKYKDKIQLVLCGIGPWKKKLMKLDNKYLSGNTIFKFVSQEELINTINYSDLYVHTSDADIEAIGCMEAFTCGLVPVISDNPLVATGQFALTEKNLFKTKNYIDLRDKIDYFIEHEDERQELKKQYIKYAKQYELSKCVSEMEQMFKDAIALHREKQAYYKQLMQIGTEGPFGDMLDLVDATCDTVEEEENYKRLI